MSHGAEVCFWNGMRGMARKSGCGMVDKFQDRVGLREIPRSANCGRNWGTNHKSIFNRRKSRRVSLRAEETALGDEIGDHQCGDGESDERAPIVE